MPIFYVFIALMICSGASEQAVGQWSSFFAEKGLGLSKTTADVLGTCAFAVCMGSSRLIYSLFSEKIPLKVAIFASSLLCAACFLTLGLTSSKALSVVACACSRRRRRLRPRADYRWRDRRQQQIRHRFRSMVSELALREGILSASVFPILLAAVILVLTIIGAKTNKSSR